MKRRKYKRKWQNSPVKPSDRLADLLGFVRGYNAVLAALAVGARKPFVTDPLLNAYDFRPRPGGPPRASNGAVFKALRSMGYVPDRGQDRGMFLAYNLKRIGDYLSYYTGETLPEYKVAHFICAFRHYTELKEGRKTRWKLLKT